MRVVHLTASRFFGGPERQMLELAKTLSPEIRSAFISFAENGLCQAFLQRARDAGFEALSLRHDTPRLLAAWKELVGVLRSHGVDLLCCHGYKAGLLGLLAARRLGIPTIAVSRGWTAEGVRVRLYEALDRRVLRWMDKVVCVADAQAEKVRRAGVPRNRIAVIRNAIRPERFAPSHADDRQRLQQMFPEAPDMIVGAAGRLSPEKGFGVLIDAASEVIQVKSTTGFVLFGDGPLREPLAQQIADRGLTGKCLLAGFRSDLDQLLPQLDLMVLPSFTEGLPNAALEALAAGVPLVATAVGGTPELVEDGETGCLVSPGNPQALAARIVALLSDPAERQRLKSQGADRIRRHFSFVSQSQAYHRLFQELAGNRIACERTSNIGWPVGSYGVGKSEW